jgi:hypothetical protein
MYLPKTDRWIEILNVLNVGYHQYDGDPVLINVDEDILIKSIIYYNETEIVEYAKNCSYFYFNDLLKGIISYGSMKLLMCVCDRINPSCFGLYNLAVSREDDNPEILDYLLSSNKNYSCLLLRSAIMKDNVNITSYLISKYDFNGLHKCVVVRLLASKCLDRFIRNRTINYDDVHFAVLETNSNRRDWKKLMETIMELGNSGYINNFDKVVDDFKKTWPYNEDLESLLKIDYSNV